MRNWIKTLSFVLMTVAVFSCGTKKTSGGQDKLPKLKEDKLVAVLDSIHRSSPVFFSARIDTKYSDKNQNLSFKTSLKINSDTATHALISYAGIPVITAMVTPDSVKVSNKREKCYMLQDLNFFKEQFGIDFSYLNLEELLLGRPLNFSSKQTYYLMDDPYNYILSTQKERKDEGKLLVSYLLTPDLKHLQRVEITSFKDEVEIVVNYSTYVDDRDFSSPKTVYVGIKSPKNKISIAMTYDKIELNVPKEMVIVIPESYEKCK